MTAAWIALTVNVVGAVYAFGVRSYLAWRATGDTGLRMSTRASGMSARWAKALFVAALLLSLAAPAAALAGMPQAGRAVAAAVAGALLAGAGLVLVVAAQLAMGTSWRVGVDHDERTVLVTGGLFAVCRNPVFTGMAAVSAGTLLLVPNLLSVVGLGVLTAALQLQVRAVEEPYLLAVHGAAYRRYAARVGRFVPLLGRLAPPSHDPAHDDDHDHDHGDGHDHGGHGHGGHAHGVSRDADRRWLGIALAVIAAFMAVEVVVGVLAQSLALVSDAAHMLTDAIAIVLALVAMRIAARPAGGRYTFGLARAEVLSAAVNGLSLLLLAGWLGVEAVLRLSQPPEVTGWMVVVTGLVGLAVNVLAAWAIGKANRSSLNIEGAYQHVLMDMFASIAAIAAGVVVMVSGWSRADAVATLVVVALMVRGGWGLVRDACRVLLNAAPPDVRPDALGADMLGVDGVVEVHDLHVWAIDSGQAALSAHVLVGEPADCHQVRQALERQLAAAHRITHTTLQVDHRAEEISEQHCTTSHGQIHRR
jgi:cobalt-zinc-cadmium efflux system protein